MRKKYTNYDTFLAYINYRYAQQDKEGRLKNNPLRCYYLIKNNSLDSLTDFVEQYFKCYISARTSDKCGEMAQGQSKHIRRIESINELKNDEPLLRQIATKIAIHLKSLL